MAELNVLWFCKSERPNKEKIKTDILKGNLK